MQLIGYNNLKSSEHFLDRFQNNIFLLYLAIGFTLCQLDSRERWLVANLQWVSLAGIGEQLLWLLHNFKNAITGNKLRFVRN